MELGSFESRTKLIIQMKLRTDEMNKMNKTLNFTIGLFCLPFKTKQTKQQLSFRLMKNDYILSAENKIENSHFNSFFSVQSFSILNSIYFCCSTMKKCVRTNYEKKKTIEMQNSRKHIFAFVFV